MILLSNFLPFAPGFIRVVAALYICFAAVYTTNSVVSSFARLAIARLPREMVESSAFLQRIGDLDAAITGLQSDRAAEEAKAGIFF